MRFSSRKAGSVFQGKKVLVAGLYSLHILIHNSGDSVIACGGSPQLVSHIKLVGS